MGMEGEQATSVVAPAFKAGSAVVLIGGLTTADVSNLATAFAAVVAAIYSVCLLCEWIHKKFWRKHNSRRSD